MHLVTAAKPRRAVHAVTIGAQRDGAWLAYPICGQRVEPRALVIEVDSCQHEVTCRRCLARLQPSS